MVGSPPPPPLYHQASPILENGEQALKGQKSISSLLNPRHKSRMGHCQAWEDSMKAKNIGFLAMSITEENGLLRFLTLGGRSCSS
jgi:hypothetical protein